MNCQLYGGWRLGKRKPGVITDGERLVEVAGEGIEVRGVGFGWGVRVGASKGNSASVVDLCDEALREEAVGVGEGDSVYVWEGGGYALGKGVGSGAGSGAKKRLEAWERGDTDFISLFTSLATSVAEVPFVFFVFFPGPEPAACA